VLGVRCVEWLRLDEDSEFKKEVSKMVMDAKVKELLPLREESLDPLPREMLVEIEQVEVPVYKDPPGPFLPKLDADYLQTMFERLQADK
jgi:hypothetical protein